MKKKNGFTLIELLAVIVILAIIALIAVPIIMNVINEAKKGAAKDSMYGYVEAVELEIAKAMISNQNLLTGEYTTKTGDLYSGSTKALSVSFKGTKPDDNGTITLTNGRVTKAELTFGGHSVTYNGTKVENDEEVLEKLCSKSSGVDLANLTYGNQFTCELGDGVNRTFYLLEQNGETISLIMDRNMGNSVAWISKEDYVAAGGTESDYGTSGKTDKGPITVMNYLREQTSNWKKLNEDQVGIPSKQQLAKASGVENTDSSFIKVSEWLYGNFQNPYTYWTTTPSTTDKICVVNFNDKAIICDYTIPSDSTHIGIRPVITIVKGNLQ